MLANCLGDREEDDAVLLELLLERRGHGDAVEHRIDGHAREALLLLQGNTQLLERLEQLRVDLVQALGRLPLLRSGIVVNGLIVDRRIRDVGPCRLGHGEPMAIGLEPPLEHPGRLAFLLGDQPNDVFAQAAGRELRLNIGTPTVLVGLLDVLVDCRGHQDSSPPIVSRSAGRGTVDSASLGAMEYSHELHPSGMYECRWRSL